MSWGKVKKINSDMSMPLDKLFRNSIRLISSDNITYHTFDSITYQSESEDQIISEPIVAIHEKFKIDCDGNAKMNVSITLNSISDEYFDHTTYGHKGFLTILRNGDVWGQSEGQTVFDDDYTYKGTQKSTDILYNDNISFRKGDVWEMIVSYTRPDTYQRSMHCAIKQEANLKAVPILGGFELIEVV